MEIIIKSIMTLTVMNLGIEELKCYACTWL